MSDTGFSDEDGEKLDEQDIEGFVPEEEVGRMVIDQELEHPEEGFEILAQGTLYFVNACINIAVALMFLASGQFLNAMVLAAPMIGSTAAQMYSGAKRGVEFCPLAAYPTQVHHVVHALGCIESQRRTLTFVGIQGMHALIAAWPSAVFQAIAISGLDPEELMAYSRARNSGAAALLASAGEAVLGFAILLNIAAVAVFYATALGPRYKIKKTERWTACNMPPCCNSRFCHKHFSYIACARMSCGATYNHASLVVVYSFFEMLVSIMAWAVLAAASGWLIAAIMTAPVYGMLVLCWRWWAPSMAPNQVDTLIVACFAALPNLLGVVVTGGDSETNVVYAYHRPLTSNDREFMRNGVWLPDFLCTHVVRMVIMFVQIGMAGSAYGTYLGNWGKYTDSAIAWGCRIWLLMFLFQHIALGAYYYYWQQNKDWGRAAISRTEMVRKLQYYDENLRRRGQMRLAPADQWGNVKKLFIKIFCCRGNTLNDAINTCAPAIDFFTDMANDTAAAYRRGRVLFGNFMVIVRAVTADIRAQVGRRWQVLKADIARRRAEFVEQQRLKRLAQAELDRPPSRDVKLSARVAPTPRSTAGLDLPPRTARSAVSVAPPGRAQTAIPELPLPTERLDEDPIATASSRPPTAEVATDAKPDASLQAVVVDSDTPAASSVPVAVASPTAPAAAKVVIRPFAAWGDEPSTPHGDEGDTKPAADAKPADGEAHDSKPADADQAPKRPMTLAERIMANAAAHNDGAFKAHQVPHRRKAGDIVDAWPYDHDPVLSHGEGADNVGWRHAVFQM